MLDMVIMTMCLHAELGLQLSSSGSLHCWLEKKSKSKSAKPKS